GERSSRRLNLAIGRSTIVHRQPTKKEAIMKNKNSYRSKLLLVLSLFAVTFLSTLAHADYILFYGGDFEPTNQDANAMAKEKDAIVNGTPYGAATFQNFIIPAGHTWTIESLFTNNLSDLTPTSGYWQLRSGLSEGNGGTLIASGTGTGSGFSWDPTSR